jgi:hypothetical protein
MKKTKLKLDELKVQSFVTSFDKEQNQTQEIYGGAPTTITTKTIGTGCSNTFCPPPPIIVPGDF